MFSSIPGIPLDARSVSICDNQSVSRHGHMSSRGQNCSQLRNITSEISAKMLLPNTQSPPKWALFPTRWFQQPIRLKPHVNTSAFWYGTGVAVAMGDFMGRLLWAAPAQVKPCSGRAHTDSAQCVAHTVKFKRKEQCKCRTEAELPSHHVNQTTCVQRFPPGPLT